MCKPNPNVIRYNDNKRIDKFNEVVNKFYNVLNTDYNYTEKTKLRKPGYSLYILTKDIGNNKTDILTLSYRIDDAGETISVFCEDATIKNMVVPIFKTPFKQSFILGNSEHLTTIKI